MAAYAGLRAAAHKQPPRHLPLGGPSLLPGGAPTSETEPHSSTRYARARDHTHPPSCLPTVCGQGNSPDVSPSRHHSRSLHPLQAFGPQPGVGASARDHPSPRHAVDNNPYFLYINGYGRVRRLLVAARSAGFWCLLGRSPKGWHGKGDIGPAETGFGGEHENP